MIAWKGSWNNHNYVNFYWKWKFDNWPANFNWCDTEKKQACHRLHNVQSAGNGQDCFVSILSLEAHIPLSFVWSKWKADFSLVQLSVRLFVFYSLVSVRLCWLLARVPPTKDERWQLCHYILWKIKHSFSFCSPFTHSGFIAHLLERCDSWRRQGQV